MKNKCVGSAEKADSDRIQSNAERNAIHNFSSFSNSVLSIIKITLILAIVALTTIIVITYYTLKNTSSTPIVFKFRIAPKEISQIDEKAAKEKVIEIAEKAFYVARKDAQQEYDRNIATMLSVLALFGIAWPIIIAVLQFKLSENELIKIATANEAVFLLRESIEKKEIELQEKFDKLVQDINRVNAINQGSIYKRFYDMSEDNESLKFFYLNRIISFFSEAYLIDSKTDKIVIFEIKDAVEKINSISNEFYQKNKMMAKHALEALLSKISKLSQEEEIERLEFTNASKCLKEKLDECNKI